MSKEIKKLLSDALVLSESDRALLAVSLIESLEPADDSDANEGWDNENTRRIQEIDSGKVHLIPWTEARKKILEGLG